MTKCEPYLAPGETVALLGSSGVGKSTLINRLLGVERLRTAEVRASDSRGRHTTTWRELILLPNGALVIDTPGLRELQLWDGGASARSVFPDIEALAADCHFRDCRHEQEPRCAVRLAVQEGRLAAGAARELPQAPARVQLPGQPAGPGRTAGDQAQVARNPHGRRGPSGRGSDVGILADYSMPYWELFLELLFFARGCVSGVTGVRRGCCCGPLH